MGSSPQSFSVQNHIKKYLDLVLKTVKVKLGFLPVSIILFGSAVKGGVMNQLSDIDVLIIVDGSVNARQRKSITAAMTGVQNFFFNSGFSGFIDRLLYFFETGTGMFKSFFICSEKDLLSACFPRIFNVNRFLSRLLVPERLVLNSVFSNYKIVYGKEYDLKNLKKPLDFFQIVKSFKLCSLLYLVFTIVNCFKRVWRYLYEAVKWSLINCYFYITGRSVKAKDTIPFFKKILRTVFLDDLAAYNNSKFNFTVKNYYKYFNSIFKLHFSPPKIYFKNFFQ
ncbi:MAG: nucleotidyltransferase domain-containing protein, partial [Candidatus Odinarchaeota archaeon]